MKTLKSAFSFFALCLMATAVQADESIRTTNLEVKERLIAIEQINVSAEKTQIEPVITSQRVARLLEEAAELEAEAQSARNEEPAD